MLRRLSLVERHRKAAVLRLHHLLRLFRVVWFAVSECLGLPGATTGSLRWQIFHVLIEVFTISRCCRLAVISFSLRRRSR